MTAWLTNNCLSIKNGVLRLAGVDDTGGMNTGSAGDRKRIKGSFQLGNYKRGCRIEKAEIQPYYGGYLLLVTYKTEDTDMPDSSAGNGSMPDKEADAGNVMGIDLGIQNAAAIADNTGERPVVIMRRPAETGCTASPGEFLKSRNQYYNKYHATMPSCSQSWMQRKMKAGNCLPGCAASWICPMEACGFIRG